MLRRLGIESRTTVIAERTDVDTAFNRMGSEWNKKLCNVESDMTTMNIMLLKHTFGDKLGTQLEQTEHYYYANTM